jgi:hypothetical protein
MLLPFIVIVLNAICVALYGGQAIAFERNRNFNAVLWGIWFVIFIINLTTFVAFRH